MPSPEKTGPVQGILDYHDLDYCQFAIPVLIKLSIYSNVAIPGLLGFQFSVK